MTEEMTESSHLAVGIDTGGTFTDVVLAPRRGDGAVVSLKVPSSRDAPGGAILQAFEEVDLDTGKLDLFTHGTTVGTNALIERTGCCVGYLTTAGFEDTPFIQRINRATLYDLSWKKPSALVGSRQVCLGLSERIGAHGEVVRPLDELQVRERCQQLRAAGVEAIAVCLLFSYLNTAHERRVKDIVRQELPDVPISVSHEVAPIWREYERSSTTIADAYLKPLMERYVVHLGTSLGKAGFDHPWTIMKSNGGVMLSGAAAEFPVQTINSGPAGGMIAAEHVSRECGATNVLTLDMGGTSADVGILLEGRQRHTIEYEIEWGLPAAVPIIDIQSIGAGGGSIAWIDNGKMLRVGPRSSGAAPGPACYGRGGGEATVTDANLLLGRLDEEYFLGGKMSLQRQAAEKAVRRISEPLQMDLLEAAASIVEIANENMANAIKKVSLERGHDPRIFSLLAFGGAGPLHAAAVGSSLSVSEVIVPPLPGVFSALGLLLADLRVDKVWTQSVKSTEADALDISRRFAQIERLAIAELREEGFDGSVAIRRAVTARYLGQNYEHEVQLGEGTITPEAVSGIFQAFAGVHQQRYGYEIEDEIVELVSFQVTAIGKRPTVDLSRVDAGHPRPSSSRQVYFRGQGWKDAHVLHRSALAPGQSLDGPAVVEEAGSTTLVGPGMCLRANPLGTLHITFANATPGGR
jgi:N-methylhydantoinase A